MAAKKGAQSAKKGAFKSAFKKGMTKKDVEKGSGIGREDSLWIPKGETVPVQFFTEPDDFITFKEHSWQEDRRWFFVPCTGDECVLCDDESDERRRRGDQFAAQVYNHKEKKAQVLKGGKDLGGRIWGRYERKPSMFVKRVFEITKYATQPISFEVIPAEDKPVNLGSITAIDLEEWWEKQVKAYYGDDIPKASALDDDDEDEDEDDDWEDDEEDEEEDDEDEEDEDDEDEEDEDDEDEEDEEPAPKRRAPAKKAQPAAKKAAAKGRR